jgi:2-hydroxyglutarate dehydrogenase
VNAQLVLLPKLVINSAGLSAVPLAKQFHGLDQAFVPTPHYARGCYFTLSQTKSPFSRLIYPLPEDGGIGVHVTLDLNGLVRFGPDVEWISDGGKDHVSCFLNK